MLDVSLHHPPFFGVAAPVGDVVAHRVVEEDHLLRDQAHERAQRLEGGVANVAAVDGDAAAVHVVEAREEIDQRRLAGAAAAHDGHDLAGSDGKVDVEQAPRTLLRVDATYSLGAVTNTLQLSHTGDSFGDANNSVMPGDSPAAGFVPAYTVLDWTGDVRLNTRYQLSFGVNNLLTALTRDGKKIWERSITEEFSPFTTHGGRTVSPIVDGNLVIVSTPTSTWGSQAA